MISLLVSNLFHFLIFFPLTESNKKMIMSQIVSGPSKCHQFLSISHWSNSEYWTQKWQHTFYETYLTFKLHSKELFLKWWTNKLTTFWQVHEHVGHYKWIEHKRTKCKQYILNVNWFTMKQKIFLSNTKLCPIIFNVNTITLTVHTSCY